MKICFFGDGNTYVSKNGSQFPELQVSWFSLYVDFLRSKGFTDEQLDNLEFSLPTMNRCYYSSKYNNWSDKPWPNEDGVEDVDD